MRFFLPTLFPYKKNVPTKSETNKTNKQKKGIDMKKLNKDFEMLVFSLEQHGMGPTTKEFMAQQERAEMLKNVSPTDVELLFDFFCFMYKTYNDNLSDLKKYIDTTDGQIDNAIMKSLFESQNQTLNTLYGWIKTLCDLILKFFGIVDAQNSTKLLPLVISDGIDQLKRYVGSRKSQESDMIEILKAQKDIENTKILPDAKMDEILGELKVSFHGLERYFSRISLQDSCLDPFLDEAAKFKRQQDANTVVKNQKRTLGRFISGVFRA